MEVTRDFMKITAPYQEGRREKIRTFGTILRRLSTTDVQQLRRRDGLAILSGLSIVIVLQDALQLGGVAMGHGEYGVGFSSGSTRSAVDAVVEQPEAARFQDERSPCTKLFVNAWRGRYFLKRVAERCRVLGR